MTESTRDQALKREIAAKVRGIYERYGSDFSRYVRVVSIQNDAAKKPSQPQRFPLKDFGTR